MIVPDVADAASFDSELRTTMMNQTTNAELTLVLRIFLQQVAGGTVNDADNRSFTTAAWNQRVWQEWTARYQREAQAFWSGKYWLKTPVDNDDLIFTQNPGNIRWRCNVWCRFRLELATSAGTAHKTIQVANIVLPRGSHPTAGTFRSHETLYDQYDLGYGVYTRTDGAGHAREYYQRTFVHEVGHALGLPHIGQMTHNAQCTADSSSPQGTNSDSCYGTVHSERRDVMGFGERRSLHDGTPWQNRIGRHFTTPGLTTVARLFELHQQRVYPVRLTT